jgi:hypothetical protein
MSEKIVLFIARIIHKTHTYSFGGKSKEILVLKLGVYLVTIVVLRIN